LRGRSLRRALSLLLLAGLLWVAQSTVAQAQHGALSGHALLDPDGRYGGAILAEALWGEGILRAGGSLGTGAVSNAGQERSGAFGVLGGALWVGPVSGRGPCLVLRLGLAAGAEKGGLTAGLWAAPAVGYAFGVGDAVRLRVSAEAWVVHDDATALLLSPAVGLTW